MCGIVALFSNDEHISESSLKLGMDCLKHRGPDGQGFWISPDRRFALDHKVVELVRNMPVALKIRGLTEKYVLREAAKPLITETIYNRQKHPYRINFSTMVRA